MRGRQGGKLCGEKDSESEEPQAENDVGGLRKARTVSDGREDIIRPGVTRHLPRAKGGLDTR